MTKGEELLACHTWGAGAYESQARRRAAGGKLGRAGAHYQDGTSL